MYILATYKCETVNTAGGSASSSIILSIQSQPYFRSKPSNTNASNTDTVEYDVITF